MRARRAAAGRLELAVYRVVPVIRVLIADDEAIVRDGLRAIVELERDLEVVAEAADGEQAVELAGS